MKMYSADLHIHTCLSPCAELEMSPKGIVKTAKKKESILPESVIITRVKMFPV